MDKITDLAKELRPFLLSVATSVVRMAVGNKIILYHPLAEVSMFDVTSAGLDQAIAAAVSGDYIDVPGACTIDGDHTLPAGVILGGRGGNAIFTGTITLGSGGGVRDVGVVCSGDGNLTCVVGPDSGTAFIRDCFIYVSSDDGTGIGVQVGDGDISIVNCHVQAFGLVEGIGVNSGNGAGYVYGGQPVEGSTEAIRTGEGLRNEYPFTSDYEGWVEDIYASSGLPEEYTSVNWSPLAGHDALGAVFVNMHSANNNERSGGIRLETPGKIAHEGDIFRAWFQKTAETAPGGRITGSYLQIYFTDAATQYAYDYAAWAPDWTAVEITVSAGNDGKEVDYIIAFFETGGWATGAGYIDDVLLPWADEGLGPVYTNGPQMDYPQGIPLQGERAAWDVQNYPDLHTNDADDSLTSIHHSLGTGATQAAAGDHEHDHSNLNGVDTDASASAIHHTLGTGGFQAATGDHTHDASIAADTTDFDRLLSTADDTIQKALDALDDSAAGIAIENAWSADQIMPRVQSIFDQALSNVLEGEHFTQNQISMHPANWAEVDAPAGTNTNRRYSFWFITGRTTDTTWRYDRQTSILFDNSQDIYHSLIFGQVGFRDGQWTSGDIEYTFGVYADNAGVINTSIYNRVRVQWNYIRAKWQARAEHSDGVTPVTGDWQVFSWLQPELYIRLLYNGYSTRKYNRSYIGTNPFYTTGTLLKSTTYTTAPVYGTAWLSFRLETRPVTGVDDYVALGFVDYLEGLA